MIQPSKSVQLRSGRDVPVIAVTVADAAELLGISPSTLRTKLVVPANGEPEIASIKLGGCRVIWVGELARWAEAATERGRRPAPPVPTPIAEVFPQSIERVLGRTNKRPRIHAVPRSPPASDAA